MTHFYASNECRIDLVKGLSHSNPRARLDSVHALQRFRVYAALPFLLDHARHDEDPEVRTAAVTAVRHMFPTDESANNAVHNRAPGGVDFRNPNPLGTANRISYLFQNFILDRMNKIETVKSDFPVLDEDPLRTPVMDYLLSYGHNDSHHFTEVGLAGSIFVGMLARYLEVPSSQSEVKISALRETAGAMTEFLTLLEDFIVDGELTQNGLKFPAR